MIDARIVALQGFGGGARAVALQGLGYSAPTQPEVPLEQPPPYYHGGGSSFSSYRTAPDRHEIPMVLMDGDDEETVITMILLEIAKNVLL